jgi:hypothetical protein
VLALIPTASGLVGFVHGARDSFTGYLRYGSAYFANNIEWMFVVIGACFLAMSLKLTFDMRDFSWMKAIYLFPALPCGIVFFVRGSELCQARLASRLNAAIPVFVALLLLLYVADVALLIFQLHSTYAY